MSGEGGKTGEEGEGGGHEKRRKELPEKGLVENLKKHLPIALSGPKCDYAQGALGG